MAAITVFGTVCVDKIFRVAHLPASGEYVEAQAEYLSLGGEAANTAAALKKWGADVHLIGNPPGCDDDGKLLQSLLGSADLPAATTRWGQKTPVCNVYVAPNGARYMVGAGFSRAAVPAELLGSMPGGGWFTADPNTGGAREAVAEAKRRKMSIYLMDFTDEKDADLVSGCQVWQTSTDWAGTPGNDERNLAFVAQQANSSGCTCLLTDGDIGIFFAPPGEPACKLPAFKIENIVDTTGSGDILRAGVLFNLANSEEGILSALKFGAAAAAINCRALGAVSGIPSVQEIQELIASQSDIANEYM